MASVDVIVELDACFKHKRRKGKGMQGDPSHIHPETVFVSKEEVSSMEDFVETVRPQTTGDSRTRAAQEHDGFEGPTKVPSSVLDECYESFLAADKKRQKASTQFFSDTGLMALLCRHDHVLWLVNMTSAGERQHYALVLLNTLFKHLPSEMRVGLLYDIGCQLHRSCIKWGFLKEFQDRITFGISVFHAYGHQWPCQIIYHPRKCCGFGLTDGEGCERFWSAIKSLISSLRMAGVSYGCNISYTQSDYGNSTFIEFIQLIVKSNICTSRHFIILAIGCITNGLIVARERQRPKMHLVTSTLAKMSCEQNGQHKSKSRQNLFIDTLRI